VEAVLRGLRVVHRRRPWSEQNRRLIRQPIGNRRIQDPESLNTNTQQEFQRTVEVLPPENEFVENREPAQLEIDAAEQPIEVDENAGVSVSDSEQEHEEIEEDEEIEDNSDMVSSSSQIELSVVIDFVCIYLNRQLQTNARLCLQYCFSLF
jgi:hypothetical protein